MITLKESLLGNTKDKVDIAKKDVINFIETLVDNPDKFDVLFSHTEDCKKSTNYFIEKDLLNL